MLLLGIDHGSAITGYGLIEAKSLPSDNGPKVEFLYKTHGLIERPKGMTYPYSVKYMIVNLRQILATHRPDYVALEAPKDNRGFKSTQVLTELLGAVKGLLMETGYGFVEIPPSTMKKHITGYGWSDKEEVARATAQILGLEFDQLVKAEVYASGAKKGQVKKLLLDGSDALALALTLIEYSKKTGGLQYNPKVG